MGRGYSGNHPRFSKKQDERYDAKEAYNKDLTASARLHYLENDRHDHESPMHKHNRAHRLREKAIKISERSGAERGDEYDYENPRVTELLEKAKKIEKRSDERSGEERRKDIDEMIYERPDSPVNETREAYEKRLEKVDKKGRFIKPSKVRENKPSYDAKLTYLKKPITPEGFYMPPSKPRPKAQYPTLKPRVPRSVELGEKKESPLDACAKSEGGKGCVQKIGDAWRVISNKTDKPWPARYASKAKADAALRGYHAG